MPQGEAVAAPPGFTDLCRRDEATCGESGPEALAMTGPSLALAPTSSTGAAATFSFASQQLAAPSAEETPFPTIRFEVLQAYRPVIDADFVPAGQPARPQAESRPIATLAVNLSGKEALRLLNTVNQRVNREVHSATDFDLYGMLEYWSLPRVIDGKMYGDCEDYALEKRRRLVAAGVPASALSMAVAVTARGETHAVLVVSLPSGDWVLDNLTPWATPWQDLNYHWVQRQVAGSSRWIAIG